MEAQIALAEWKAAFKGKKVYVTLGNHDIRMIKKIRSQAAVTPNIFSNEKILFDILGYPAEWTYVLNNLVVSHQGTNILLSHGTKFSPTPGRIISKTGMSTCIGHYHTKSYIYYQRTVGKTKFEMVLGGGTDPQAICNAYKHGILLEDLPHVGVIENGVPHLIPMKDGYKGGKL